MNELMVFVTMNSRLLNLRIIYHLHILNTLIVRHIPLRLIAFLYLHLFVIRPHLRREEPHKIIHLFVFQEFFFLLHVSQYLKIAYFSVLVFDNV